MDDHVHHGVGEAETLRGMSPCEEAWGAADYELRNTFVASTAG